MYNIILYEDSHYSDLYPLTYFRPVWDLRCGAFSLKQRLAKSTKSSAVYQWTSRARREFSGRVTLSPGPVLLVNGRAYIFRKDLVVLMKSKGKAAIVVDGLVAALKVDDVRDVKKLLSYEPDASAILKLAEGARPIGSDSTIFNHLWEMVDFNGQAIESDRQYYNTQSAVLPSGVHLLGKSRDLLLSNKAEIEPGSVIDTRLGPVIIEAGARVRPFSLVEGPCYIGPGSLIDGAKLRPGVSVGQGCRLAGEVEATVILDYTNKHHDGFLGHSYVGSWVNLGAMTCNSDLKNNYGSIDIWSNGRYVDSGLIKAGCFIGDHSKTAIGTMINTGTVIGACCSIFGGAVRKYLPSFAWGSSERFTEHKLEQALKTCRTVMARRGCQLTEVQENLIRRLYQETAGERRHLAKGGRS